MICAFIFLFLLIREDDKLTRYIYAVITWMTVCFIITEGLSVFRAISTVNLRLIWCLCDGIMIIVGIIKYRKLSFKKSKMPRQLYCWGVFAAGMIILALMTVPYNWDSMTYHLPRLFHWLQNGSIKHFATNIERQVSSPVLGAYVNLHVYAMTNQSDIFLNLLQCFSFLTNGIIVYNVAGKIGCSKRYCMIAIILFYSMPIAFAEALTTQVDNFSTLWILCFIYLLMDMLDEKKQIYFNKMTLIRIVCLSLCIAYGYLAKPSIGIGLVFFAIWLLIVILKRKDKAGTIISYFFIAVSVITLVLVPELQRNVHTFRALSSPGTGKRQLVGTVHERYLLVNGMKNFTFNMPTVWLYNSPEVIWNCTIKLAEVLDIDVNDPSISEDGREFMVHVPQNYGHDTAVNPMIVWLMIGCFFLWISANRKKGFEEKRNIYFIVSSIAFLVFCVILRWEPFVSRYMLSYLAILCPAVAGELEMFFDYQNTFNKKTELQFITILYFLCIVEFAGLVYCHGKNAMVQTRDTGYFVNRKEIEENYKEMADLINNNGYRNIGLIMGGDSYEFPLTVMINDYDRIEHIDVKNDTSQYENMSFVPDCIVTIDNNIPETNILYHNNEYVIVTEIDESICLFKKLK